MGSFFCLRSFLLSPEDEPRLDVDSSAERLSQSNLGIQIKEPIGLGWSLVGQLEGGFDPYSLEFANSPRSAFTNVGVPVDQQTTNGDSSRAGQLYNSVGFVGISSDAYGARRSRHFRRELVRQGQFSKAAARRALVSAA
jgi:predicted porin